MIFLKKDPKKLAKEYYQIKSEIDLLESRKKRLKQNIFNFFDDKGVNEIFADEIKLYRTYTIRDNWDEEILKQILEPKGLWEKTLSPDSKKIKKLIKSGIITEYQIRDAKKTTGSWYTYVTKINPQKTNKNKHFPEKISSNDTPSEQRNIIVVINDISFLHNKKFKVYTTDWKGKQVNLPLFDELPRYINSDHRCIEPFSAVKIPKLNEYSSGDECSFTFVRKLSMREKKKFLEKHGLNSLTSAFKENIFQNKFLKSHMAINKNVIIKISNVIDLNLIKSENQIKCILSFLDNENKEYNLPVKDYYFINYVQELKDEKYSDAQITNQLLSEWNYKEIYLGIGLENLAEDIHLLYISNIHHFNK